MIIDGNTIYVTSDENEQLKDAMISSNEGVTFKEVSEAIMRLAVCINNSVRDFSEFSDGLQELKTVQKRFRCRVCGRRYDFKGEAKACERDHRLRRFR